MTWAKLDDNFYQHPKVIGLSDKAFRLYVASICFASANRTDGEIPRAALPMIGGTTKLASELTGVALWDTTSRDGWAVHDYLKYNRSKETIESLSESRRAGGKASAAKRQQLVEQNGEPEGEQLAGKVFLSVSASASEKSKEGVPVEKRPPKRRDRAIEDADKRRWEGLRPELDIEAFVADYLNWDGSKGHRDQVQGFENQMRIGWKVEQFTRPECRQKGNGNGIGSNNARGGSFPQLTRPADAKGPGRTPDLVG
jgi:hypothetical protein